MAYIDRNELINNLNKFAPEHYNALINQLIVNQPATDVVEVVRCKDCKYYKTSPLFSKKRIKFCYKTLKIGEIAIGHGFKENDFCSYGERKPKKDG